MFNGQISGASIYGFLLDLCSNGCSGNLICKGESCTKTVVLWKGRILSAVSTLIDDRMGDVIYRRGLLSLDTFVDAASKVTKTQRFGEILISTGAFTSRDLWAALTNQSQEIVASLCFYDELQLSFEKISIVPKNEVAVNFELSRLLQKSMWERAGCNKFDHLARKSQVLTLVANWESLAKSDFDREIAGLVADHRNYATIVDTASRLSPIYTTRALFDIFCKGMLQDTLGYTQAVLSAELISAMVATVEEANFMFVELCNAAQTVGISDWSQIVKNAELVLRRELGECCIILPNEGIVADSILRVVTNRATVENLFSNAENSLFWRERNPVRIVQEAIYASILFVMFELFNRNFRSTEFSQVRTQIDEMYFPKRLFNF